MPNSNVEILSKAAGIQPFRDGYSLAAKDSQATLGDKIYEGAQEAALFFMSPSSAQYVISHVHMPPEYGRGRLDGSVISDRQARRERDARFLANSVARLLAIDAPTMVGALKAALLVTALTGNPILGGAAGIATKVAENFIVHRVSTRNSRRRSF